MGEGTVALGGRKRSGDHLRPAVVQRTHEVGVEPSRVAIEQRLDITRRQDGPAAVPGIGRLPGVMSEIEIGRNKRGRRSYSFDDVAVVRRLAGVS